MIDLNSTLLIQIINFIILIFILNAILYKPIMKVLETRKKRVDDSKTTVDSYDDLIARKMADYEETLRRVRAEALERREEIKNEGAEEGKRILAGARDEITKMIQDFKDKVSAEKEHARRTLKDQTHAIALEISEKVLGRKVQ
ncbi:MAG: ATP synthase F0 subunit B [Syntrophales bacterium]|jgi:F-type H+-transporting ATPase subunit b|nr:ATP synthase F0 subunit B [Syntrophales bacterium]MDY0044283.1 ATP synthase F0 subunit B [Syntrophales bacterium]